MEHAVYYEIQSTAECANYRSSGFVSSFRTRRDKFSTVDLFTSKIPPTTELDWGVGSASRGPGGRDKLRSSDSPFNRWVPPSAHKRDASPNNALHDAVFRKVRAILNKLTPEKFDKLAEAILPIGLDSDILLKGVILLIIDKALDEPKYCFLYARLCKRLAQKAPNFESPGSPCTFYRVLLNKCNDEFDNRSSITRGFEERVGPLSPKDAEQLHIAKRKMLGNVCFISELGKLGVVPESVLHSCAQELLPRRRQAEIRDLCADIECLCQLMASCGARLDSSQGRRLMDQYYDRMAQLARMDKLPVRIRFMLQNSIELRANGWRVRPRAVQEAPRPVSSIREEARARGVHLPGGGGGGGGRAATAGVGPMFLGAAPGGRQQRGMEDVFGAGFSTLGTGPGVIGMDGGGARNGAAHKFNNNGAMRGYNASNKQQQLFLNAGGGAHRDLPPRFKRMVGGLEDLSLRPAANSMVFKPQTPMAGPGGMMGGVRGGVRGTELIQADKQRTAKVKPLGADQLRDRLLELLEQQLWKSEASEQQMETVAAAWKQVKLPNKHAGHVLYELLVKAAEKTDADRDRLMSLLSMLRKSDSLSQSHVTEALRRLLTTEPAEYQQPDQPDQQLVPATLVAGYLAGAVAGGLMTLSDTSAEMDTAAHYPLFFVTLQQLQTRVGKERLVDLFNDNKVSALKQLPGGQSSSEEDRDQLAAVLERHQLQHLCPLLGLQAELLRQLCADPSESSFYRWIRANVPASLHAESDFIQALFTSVLHFITEQCKTDSVGSVNTTSNTAASSSAAERQQLLRFRQLLQAFTHEQQQLQMWLVYALQTFCHQLQFPRGLLLRWFVMLYDLEIVDEEAFMLWREDISEQYPGKGKALFQVNQWLTWLEQAESDDEDDEAEDDE